MKTEADIQREIDALDTADTVILDVRQEFDDGATSGITEITPSPSIIGAYQGRAISALVRELAARFPLFSAPSPMKLGVNVELQQFCRAAIPEDIMSRTRVRLAVNYFLSQWAKQPEYQAALKAGGPRFDLWMNPCGGVLDEEADHHKYRMMRQEATKLMNAQA